MAAGACVSCVAGSSAGGASAGGESSADDDGGILTAQNSASHNKFVRELYIFNREFRDKMNQVCVQFLLMKSRNNDCDAHEEAILNDRDTKVDNMSMKVAVVYDSPYSTFISVRRGAFEVSVAEIRRVDESDDIRIGEYACILHTYTLQERIVHPLRCDAQDVDFFVNRGFGGLALVFMLLYTVRMRVTLQVVCENKITALLMYRIFGAQFASCDVEVHSTKAQYKQRLFTHEQQARAAGGGADSRQMSASAFVHFYSTHGYKDVAFLVRATDANAAYALQFITQWQRTRGSGLDCDDFFERYMRGDSVQKKRKACAHTPPSGKGAMD